MFWTKRLTFFFPFLISFWCCYGKSCGKIKSPDLLWLILRRRKKSPELFRLILWKDKNHLTCSDQFRWETKITWRVLTNPIERQKSPDLLWPILWTDKITWPVLTNPIERQKSPDLFWPIPLRDKNHRTCSDQSHRETKITWPVMTNPVDRQNHLTCSDQSCGETKITWPVLTNPIERQKSPDLLWPIPSRDKNHLTCSDQSCGKTKTTWPVLTNPVGSGSSLKVVLWVEITVHKNDGVCCCQVQPLATCEW